MEGFKAVAWQAPWMERFFLLGQVKALAIKAHESYPELVDAMKKHKAPR